MTYFYGLLNFSLWQYIVVTLVLMHVTVMCITLYLHRTAAHSALELHPIAAHFFRFWLWFATATVTKEWVAIHRKHHATSDTEADPHSPQIYGLKKVMTQGYELYKKESKNKETLSRYGHGTPDDWLERHIYTPHSSLGIGILFVLDLVLFGVPGITIWAIQMMTQPVLAAGIINGMGHYIGYRNFETPDASTNVMPWGIIAGGEELHNNHHAFGASAKLSVRKFEFDIGWMYIRALQFCKLAKPRRVIPKLEQSNFSKDIDVSTLTAIITHRFHLLKQYGEMVIQPIVLHQMSKDKERRQLWRQAQVWLNRNDDRSIDANSRKSMQALLATCSELNVVYQYKLRLQNIWTKAVSNNAELVQQLKQWCVDAEKAGIQTLQQFSLKLTKLGAANE
jgi:stearoyl-CoA desaturase (delta-9 desaturase)